MICKLKEKEIAMKDEIEIKWQSNQIELNRIQNDIDKLRTNFSTLRF